jgi:Lar family restriction alleviation protein
MSELKPCPFCKDERLAIEQIPIVVRSPDGSERHIRDYAITCENCDALGPPANSTQEAAYLWNMRLQP